MHWLILLIDLFTYLGLGVAVGLLSGLFGAGGGLVAVPGLLLLFRYQHINPTIGMHIAVGTSLAMMIPVALRSLMSHRKKGVIFFAIYKQLAPTVIIGVVSGAILAHFLHGRILEIAFGILALCMAALMILQKANDNEKSLPGPLGMSLVGGFVGLQSGLLGVAGSAFSVPFLTHRGVAMRVAVVVSVAIAATVSVLGATTFVITGLHATGVPMWSTGYVYWPAWIGLVTGGVFIAPLGTQLSHRISEHRLRLYFAGFLVVVGVHMLWVF